MGLLVGFILGLVASLIASYIFAWLTPLSRVGEPKQIKVYLFKPWFWLRLSLHTDERRIKERIIALFEAWKTRSLEDYLSCWANNAIRLPHPMSDVMENKEVIEKKFLASCQRYSVIEVKLIIENISINVEKMIATANVYYKFDLTRADVPTLINDESREVYHLKKIGGVWYITANIDYYRDLMESKIIWQIEAKLERQKKKVEGEL